MTSVYRRAELLTVELEGERPRVFMVTKQPSADEYQIAPFGIEVNGPGRGWPKGQLLTVELKGERPRLFWVTAVLADDEYRIAPFEIEVDGPDN
jgi:hypothetical protein